MVWLQQPGSRLWGLSSLPPGRRADTQIQEHPCLDCAPERVPLNRGSCSWGSGQQASHGDGSEMELDRPCVGPHPIGLQGQVMPSFSTEERAWSQPWLNGSGILHV